MVNLQDAVRLERLFRQWVGAGDVDIERLYNTIRREYLAQRLRLINVSRQLQRETRADLNFVGSLRP